MSVSEQSDNQSFMLLCSPIDNILFMREMRSCLQLYKHNSSLYSFKEKDQSHYIVPELATLVSNVLF